MMSVCRAIMDVSICATIFMEAIPVHVLLGFPSTETTGLVQVYVRVVSVSCLKEGSNRNNTTKI